MKRIFAIVVSLLAVTALSAQEKERSYDEFQRSLVHRSAGAV